MKAVNLYFDDDGVRAKTLRTHIDFPWSDIRSVEIEGPDEVQKRVTATRLIGLGVFAFAAKKKQKHAYVTVTSDDGEAIFETDKHTPKDLRAKLQWVQQRVSADS